MKTKRTIYTTIFSLILIVNLCIAQQDAQYTQYMYNTISVNPAYAGTRESLSIVALHRTQWRGLEGAPSTQTLSMDTSLGYQKFGLGLSIINEKIGPTSETYFNIDLSYAIDVSETGKLSFGLKGVGHLLNVDFQKLNLSNVTDPILSNNVVNRFNPNIGAGIYYYTNKFYFGLSVPNLLEVNHFNSVNANVGEEHVNFYMISGYVFDLNEDLKFKPALLTKMVYGTPLQIDASMNFMLYNKMTFGLAYRWSAAVSALASFQLTDSIMLGFAYDRETTELGSTQFNDGSYEVLLKFEFSKRSIRRLSPRFF